MRALTRRLLASHQPAGPPGGAHGRASAVLLLLYEEGGEEHVLFQRRTWRVRHHKGEISLPGGVRDPDDESLLATALRETHEEIGVAPEHVEVLGRLDSLETISGYAITPYVGAITAPAPYPFAVAPREVEELLHVPLSYLRSDAAVEWAVRELDGERGAERSFRFGEHLIWGATARIVSNYLDLLEGALAAEAR